MPTLSERREDIPLMVDAFIKEFAAETGKHIEGISDEALNILCAYEWRGNVRELRNCIERMVVMSREKILQVNSIPAHVIESANPGFSVSKFNPQTLNLEENEKAIMIKALEQTSGNKSKAAELLGISRRTMHRKCDTYGIE
jgi:DNA-binding NtrC family response regulator